MPGQMMMTPETLAPRLGAPDAPVLIDVCLDEDFELDPRLIPGAFRHPFPDIGTLAPGLQGREVVVICQRGLKLSQGAAALLRVEGVDAAALAGGMAGWAELGFAAIPADAAPRALVVSPAEPTAPALATLWLIKRFARRDVRVLFVSADAAPAVADRFGATLAPAWRAALRHWRLDSPALSRLATCFRPEAPEGPGVLAALRGLRTLHPDDLSYFAASLSLFDAVYRACLDESARAEGAAA